MCAVSFSSAAWWCGSSVLVPAGDPLPLSSVVPGQEGFGLLQEVWGVGQLGWGGISEIHPLVKMQRKEMLHGMI